MSTRRTSAAARAFARLAVVAAIAAAAFVAAVTPAPAAFAHDELVRTDPSDGATLEHAPTAVTLTFGEAPDPAQGATLVEVRGPSGAQLQDGAPTIAGSVVTQRLTPGGDASGTYSVRWKVVSADGHPVAGQFAFTVAGASAPSVVAPSPSARAPASAVPGVPGWVVAVIVVVAVGAMGAVVYLLVTRARRAGASAGRATSGDPPVGR